MWNFDVLLKTNKFIHSARLKGEGIVGGRLGLALGLTRCCGCSTNSFVAGDQLQGLLLVWTPPNLTKSQTLYKIVYLRNLGRGQFVLTRAWDLGKPSKEKICFCLVFSILPWPPPAVFWNPLRNFFQNLILYELKFLKVFGLWLSPQI